MKLENPIGTQEIKEEQAEVPVPQKNLEFDQTKVETWLDAEPDEEIKAVKQKLIEHLQHISFEEFQTKAKKVIKEALEGVEDEKYAVLFDYKPHSSKRWMFELNKNCFTDKEPAEAEFFTPSWEKMGGNNRLRQLTEEGVNTFFITDDAGYSGEQIVNRQIEPIVKFYQSEGLAEKPKFVLAVPYVTERFLNLMKNLEKEHGCKIEVHSDTEMPTMAQTLTPEEISTLDKRGGNLEEDKGEPTYLGATLTFFDHRVADAHSFSEDIQRALNLVADKPYGNPESAYYLEEEKQFNQYKSKVFPEAKPLEEPAKTENTALIEENKARDAEKLRELRVSLGLSPEKQDKIS